MFKKILYLLIWYCKSRELFSDFLVKLNYLLDKIVNQNKESDSELCSRIYKVGKIYKIYYFNLFVFSVRNFIFLYE